MTKIRNIDKSVCTAEQVIAYNFAFSLYEYFDIDKALEYVKSSIADDTYKRFDREAIITTFTNGFNRFKNEKYHILTAYYEIGEIFAGKQK